MQKNTAQIRVHKRRPIDCTVQRYVQRLCSKILCSKIALFKERLTLMFKDCTLMIFFLRSQK